MENNDILTHETSPISAVFKNLFSSLAESLLIKLPNPPDKYNVESAISYYSRFTITDNFCLNKNSENKDIQDYQHREAFWMLFMRWSINIPWSFP